LIRLGYCLGVKSVVSIKETIKYQLEESKKNPKSSQSLQREGDQQVLRAIPRSTITAPSSFFSWLDTFPAILCSIAIELHP